MQSYPFNVSHSAKRIQKFVKGIQPILYNFIILDRIFKFLWTVINQEKCKSFLFTRICKLSHFDIEILNIFTSAKTFQLTLSRIDDYGV